MELFFLTWFKEPYYLLDLGGSLVLSPMSVLAEDGLEIVTSSTSLGDVLER